MKSRLAERSRQDLLAAVRKMSPAMRVRAFVEHSRLVAERAAAGRRGRQAGPGVASSK